MVTTVEINLPYVTAGPTLWAFIGLERKSTGSGAGDNGLGRAIFASFTHLLYLSVAFALHRPTWHRQHGNRRPCPQQPLPGHAWCSSSGHPCYLLGYQHKLRLAVGQQASAGWRLEASCHASNPHASRNSNGAGCPAACRQSSLTSECLPCAATSACQPSQAAAAVPAALARLPR